MLFNKEIAMKVENQTGWASEEFADVISETRG